MRRQDEIKFLFPGKRPLKVTALLEMQVVSFIGVQGLLPPNEVLEKKEVAVNMLRLS